MVDPSPDRTAALRAVELGREFESRQGRDERRGGGVFYTPDHLIEFVLHHALDPLLDGCTAVEQVAALRVVDPSCGGGVFLVRALERLIARCSQLGAADDRELRGRLARCVRGVDIDPAAVDVARQAVSLVVGPQRVDQDAPVLRDARFARSSGRTAAKGIEVRHNLEQACQDERNRSTTVRAEETLSEARGRLEVRRVPGLPIVVGDALDAGVVESADVVIGNPPWGQKRFKLSPQRRAELRERYQCARGAIEPASLFVELAHRVLEPGGRWGFVLPDIILLKNQRPVRELILSHSQIECLAHAGRAFDGVNLDAAVCVGSILAPEQPLEPHPVWQALSQSWRRDTPPSLVRHQSRYRQLDESRFNLFATESELDQVLSLRRGRLFGDLFEVHEGVHTGNCRDKLFVPGDGPTRRPVIVGGKELSPFRLRWAGRYLECDPAAVDRDAGDYANLGKADWFGPKKLVVRRTGDRVVCAVDERGYAVSNNLFVVLPREPMTTDELWACAGLLGSRLYTWFFRTVVPRTGRLFAELKIGPLSRFPFPPAGAWTPPRIEVLAAHARALAAAPDDEATAAALDAAVRQLFEKPTKTWSVPAGRSRVVQ